VKEFAMAESFEPAIIEAEENFLIDCQFRLQEVMTEKGITVSQLAEKAGVSKSRISQVMSPEANPTAKTFARLFHALGEEITLELKKKTKQADLRPNIENVEKEQTETWNWTQDQAPERVLDHQLVRIVKETFASNDNYAPVVMESELMMTLEAA
jgi:transcriptional regulator with XRE-family HTH domain